MSRDQKNSVICENREHRLFELSGDSIFYALGMRANEDVVRNLSAASTVPVSVIGDCRKAAKVYEAGRQGWEARYETVISIQTVCKVTNFSA